MKSYDRLLLYTPTFAGITAFLYAYFFVVAKNTLMSSVFLLLLGVAALKVVVLLYGKLKHVDENLARVAFVFGVFGAVGMALHGGYDLANTLNPPASLPVDVPNQVDPRGLLSFGFFGLGVLKLSWLMSKEKLFPSGLATLGYVYGTLLLVIYLARLTVLSPTNPVLLYPVLLNGFIVGPVWFVWLGSRLLQKS